MLQFGGPGTDDPLVMARLAAIEHIRAQSPKFGRLAVAVVQHYKHMGGINAGPFRLEQEAFARAAICREAFRGLGKRFYRNRDILPEYRLFFWKARCLSKLLHPVSTWGRPTGAAMTKYSNAYHMPLKTFAGFSPVADSDTFRQLRVAFQMPSPEVMISLRRLSLLRRVLVAPAPWLHGLMLVTMPVNRAWAQQVKADLELLKSHEPGPPPRLLSSC